MQYTSVGGRVGVRAGADFKLRHYKTTQARRDLLDLWLDIAPNDIDAADRVYARLEARLVVLRQYTELGASRPDIAKSARVLVEPPYLILYRILSDAVQIVRVLHGARRIDSALFNEGLHKQSS